MSFVLLSQFFLEFILLILFSLLIVERHTTCCWLLGQWVYANHVCLRQIVLVLDSIFYQVLKLFHFNLHYVLVYVRIPRPLS